MAKLLMQWAFRAELKKLNSFAHMIVHVASNYADIF